MKKRSERGGQGSSTRNVLRRLSVVLQSGRGKKQTGDGEATKKRQRRRREREKSSFVNEGETE